MDEFSLIEYFFSKSQLSENISLGVGDDCALIDIPTGYQLATSVDTLLEGVHFPVDGPAEGVGSRALCVALSDLAAMGAEPVAFTLAISLPELNEDWLEAFSRGLYSVANEYMCPLVGGDTTRGPLAITIQVLGKVRCGQALRRSGAMVGDAVCVSGSLGDGAASLNLIVHSKPPRLDSSIRAYLYDRYYRPAPQFELASILAGAASAAIDISDGFLADLGHVCKMSGVGAKVDLELLPYTQQLDRISCAGRIRDWMLCGGDDYQLCFSVPQKKLANLLQIASQIGVRVSCVGEIVKGAGVQLLDTGTELNMEDLTDNKGYNHFG